MPSQLQRRLARFLDTSVAHDVNGHEHDLRVDNVPAPTQAELVDHTTPPRRNTNPHWAGVPFGQEMQGIQSIMIHGTSGWPSYASADNFRQRYECIDEWEWNDGVAPAHWANSHAIGPQYFVDPNGTIFNLIGPENLEGTARFTWHSNMMSYVALGIENSDGGDSGAIVPGNAPLLFRRLNPNAAANTDLAGMKLFALLHPTNAEDVNLLWFAVFPDYTGPGDIADLAHRYARWKNTLFSERDYRSLALLCRFLLERNGLPRNFPLFPYASSEFDTGDAVLFRRLLTADPLRDQIAAALALAAPLNAGAKAFADAYGPTHRQLWSRFFGMNGAARSTPCFRGIISHLINGGHRCPGPLFDWHRFAHEVWDWWWYPFDFRGMSTAGAKPLETLRRPYQRARGDTPLVEYYFDAIGTTDDYAGQKVQLSAFPQFNLSADVPVYALANGLAIAARIRGNADAANPGFLLVRHEVFHQGAQGRIDYSLAPTTVWSLITFLQSTGFALDNVSTANPDWLNRFVIRLKECELAVAFHTANPNLAALNHGWNHQPAAGAGMRPTTGTGIERDAAEYRRLANDLVAGQAVRFPRESDDNLTAVRILLGDYIGTPAALPTGASGIQVEIFSADKLDVPGAAFGAISANGQDWWRGVVAASQAEALPAGELPSNGMAWQYSLIGFLDWVNQTTWTSEWPKYGAVDPATHVAVPKPARPNTRIVP